MVNILRKWFGWIEFEQFIYFLMWIFIAAVLGLFDFTTWKFDAYKFRDPAYWSEVGLLVALGMLVFIISLLRRSKKLKADDEEANNQIKELDNSIKESNLSEVREFLNYENKERIKRQYIADREFELVKLLDKMPDSAVDIWSNGTVEDKAKNKWCRKRKSLEHKISDKYIEENRDYLKANVVKISIGFLLTGVNSESKPRQANENPSRPVIQAVKDNWLNFLLPSVFIAALLAFVVTSSDEPTVAILLTISVKMIMLLIQQVSADYYAPTWLKATWIKDIYFRTTLMFAFFNWKKHKGGEPNGK